MLKPDRSRSERASASSVAWPRGAAALLTAAALWICALEHVDAHGAMISPMSRQWLHAGMRCELNHDNACNGNLFYDPFALNWIGTNQGATCGGMYLGDNRFEAGGQFATGEIVANYTAGQEITVEVQIWNNHWGYFELSLCDLPGNGDEGAERNGLTAACLQKHVLKKAADNTASSEKYWLYNGGPGIAYKVTGQYVLPSDVRCTRCVLRWRYVTGHECTLPDANIDLMKKVQPGGADACPLNYLEDAVKIPEKFFACADISIT